MRPAVRDSSVLDAYAKPALARVSLRRIRSTKCPSTPAEGPWSVNPQQSLVVRSLS